MSVSGKKSSTFSIVQHLGAELICNCLTTIKMRATFNVIFFVQKGKCKADGTAPILARLTVNQEKIHFSTTNSILPERWDTPNHRTIGRTQEEKAIHQALDELKASIHRHFFRPAVRRRDYLSIQDKVAALLD